MFDNLILMIYFHVKIAYILNITKNKNNVKTTNNRKIKILAELHLVVKNKFKF